MSDLPYPTTTSSQIALSNKADKLNSYSSGSRAGAMSEYNKLPFFRSLPDAPTRLVDSVKANIPYGDKALNLKAWLYFIGDESVYGFDIGRRIRIEEIKIRMNEHTRVQEAVVVFGVTVEKDMINPLGSLHGACTAYIVDLCSSAPLLALGIAQGVEVSGMSQFMNMTWHAPARLGDQLKIVSTTTSSDMSNRRVTSRCEIWDKAEKKLLASAIHTKVPQRTNVAYDKARL